MGAKKWLGKKALEIGKGLVGKSIPEAAEEVGIKFLKNYKKGMKLPKQLLKHLNVQNKPGWFKKILKLTGGAGLLGGAEEIGRAIGKEQMRAKGGYVRKMKAGGSVRRMNKGGSVSRGTGAAIKGTKFKGVF